MGTCEDLAQFQVMAGCRGNVAQLVPAPWWPDPWDERTPAEITVVGGGQALLPVSRERVEVDERPTEEEFFTAPRFTGLFVPIDAPGVADVVGAPRSFEVTAEGGRDVRAELSRFAAGHKMVAIPPSSATYDNTMLGRAGLLALVTTIVGIGLSTVAVGMIDRALERRRAVASLRVIGTPSRVLRASQLVQVMTMLTVAVLPALTAGSLAAKVFVTTQELEGIELAGKLSVTDGISQITWPLLIGCGAVALGTLLGIGARLSPQLLRRD